MNFIGVHSFLQLVSHMFFVLMTFWALKGFRTDLWLKKNHISQGRLLYLFVSISIGYTVSSFVMEFILSSQNLFYLFD